MTEETAQAAEQQETNPNDAIEKATAALAAKNSQLIAEKRKLAEDLRRFEGVDPEEFKTLKSERERLEEEKLKAEGKADEIAERRMEKAKAEYLKQIESIKGENSALSEKLKDQERNILRGQAQAAASGKVHSDESAMGIIADMAEKQFVHNENGVPVMLDQDGNVVLGKDGKTPFTLKEWVESLKDTHKFLFPSLNTGGGATGGKPGSTTKSIQRAAFFNLPPDRQAAYIREGGVLVD
jgi:hypothetical protein